MRHWILVVCSCAAMVAGVVLATGESPVTGALIAACNGVSTGIWFMIALIARDGVYE